MSRYAKDPAFFRAVYVDHMDAAKHSGELINKSVKTRGRYAMEFDDMLNEVKADAWDEGQSAGISFQAGGEYIENPYRKAVDNA